MRRAWETGNLKNQVKANPLKATGAHVGIIGHITRTELERLLTATDAANGFANRFLWVCVKRHQLLPDGGTYRLVSDAGLLRRLHDVIAAAKAVNEMHRDDAARAAWHAVYPFLSSEREGMAGAMCDRAEAQVLRISMLYALLDGSAVIRPEHLYAALALWRYAEESVLMLFRQATGDAVADTTLAALKSIHPGGLTREQLYKDVFQHHKKSDDIDRVIRSLSDKGHITVQHVSTGGRPKEVLLYNKSCTESTESTERVPDYVKVAKIAVESYMTALHRKSRESAQKVQGKCTESPGH